MFFATLPLHWWSWAGLALSVLLMSYALWPFIYLPWGKGIGTVGIVLPRLYFDLAWVNRHIQLFVAHHNTTGDLTRKSWYILTRRGFRLTHREDDLGRWQNGKHRPPLYASHPDKTIHDEAWEYRDNWKPYQVKRLYGEKIEVISFPYGEVGPTRVAVLIRKPGDSTTMRELTLAEFS